MIRLNARPCWGQVLARKVLARLTAGRWSREQAVNPRKELPPFGFENLLPVRLDLCVRAWEYPHRSRFRENVRYPQPQSQLIPAPTTISCEGQRQCYFLFLPLQRGVSWTAAPPGRGSEIAAGNLQVDMRAVAPRCSGIKGLVANCPIARRPARHGSGGWTVMGAELDKVHFRGA
eukprot:SAG11_NODE_5799_length_1461_cov_1.284875_1_plen_174_part_10